MIARLIRWAMGNRFFVLLGSVFLAAWGVYSLQHTPIDALPDLSDVQVIIRTTWNEQSPQIVEDQVTYPLTTTMLSVPGAKAAVQSAGMTSREYVVFTFSLMQNGITSHLMDRPGAKLPPVCL